ncbi:hypothetical protein RclHR1_00220037 [Rhizophagus clarus]|uniref:HMG box domain-containing protein n=1 Tax=Rhizophagus clarus TaxID=94130 RepID=A0A2Z6QTA6_9GLOM|nr:hypothetical protein RclHR1_00220037 [Rhizophagus clarus]GES84580.1 hypothetical protein GLOIN_2v1882478 [Rhizophagus clarus]
MNTLTIHSFNVKSRRIRKREPNAFILYRSDLKKKCNMKKMKMKDFSKFASESWKKLSDVEKEIWRKEYHLNRDHEDRIPNDFIIKAVSNDSAASINLTQIIGNSDIHDFDFICELCERSIGSNEFCSNCSMIPCSKQD